MLNISYIKFILNLLKRKYPLCMNKDYKVNLLFKNKRIKLYNGNRIILRKLKCFLSGDFLGSLIINKKPYSKPIKSKKIKFYY